ncbi:MAG: hypothetical protein NT062_04915 [Proteobacteria bacterium]|nr:hypothetical protein [Pseudomonadota bacterium]
MSLARLALLSLGGTLVLVRSAHADVPPPPSETAVEATAPTPTDLDLRLSLSSFLYRETGSDAPPLIDQGAAQDNASTVKRYFGDLRVELTDGGFALDGRVRQTTSQRFQSGVDGGAEYDLRTLAYRLGGAGTSVTIGRQFIDSVGATKVDGVAFHQRLASVLGVTVFAGLSPVLGSRSLATDYPRSQVAGVSGARLLPLTGGLGVSYGTPNYHGDVGVAGVYVAQDVPTATSDEASRVFTTASGYWQPSRVVDLYHFALLDVAGQNKVALTNGSVGLDVRPVADLQLTASVHHVGIDVLQIAARNLLADPDPTTAGILQNDLAVIRVSQDQARAGASLALAHQRFELSASGGVHRRPTISVPLADGSGTVDFPGARSADATFALLDRRSIAGLRASLAGTLTYPIGDDLPNRARATTVRLAASRAFGNERGALELDLTGSRFSSVGSNGGMTTCMNALDVFACFSTSKTTAAQVGALASWRVGREWIVVADAHVGYRDTTSTTIAGSTAWPAVYTVTSFVRVQWRYH